MAQPRDDELPIDLRTALCDACGAPLPGPGVAPCPICAATANAPPSAWTLLGRALLGVLTAGVFTALAYAIGVFAAGAVEGFLLGGCVGMLVGRFRPRATTVAAVYGPVIAWTVLLAAVGTAEPVRVDPGLAGATPPFRDVDPTARGLLHLVWTLFEALPTVALLTREKRSGR